MKHTTLIIAFIICATVAHCQNIPTKKQSDRVLDSCILKSYKSLKQANETLQHKQEVLYKKLDKKSKSK